PMRLELAIHPILDLRFGDATALEGETLVVGVEDLKRALLADERLTDVDVEIVQAGESCRFGGVFDVVEPRAKAPGDGSDFPGVVGPMRLAGRGTTHVLRGAVVSVLGDASGMGGQAGAGTLAEMTGSAAEY